MSLMGHSIGLTSKSNNVSIKSMFLASWFVSAAHDFSDTVHSSVIILESVY